MVELNNIGQIYPWEYPRPKTGSTINQPVVVNQFLTKRDDFIVRFSGGVSVMDSTKMKAFTYNFPSLPDSANKGELMAFLYRVSRFANHFEIYVPPPHTYTAANALGSWHDYLPYDVQLCVPTFDLQLHQVLVSKSTNLAGTPKISHLLHELSGYQILYNMARYAGHPALARTLSPESPPIQ